MNNLYNQQTPGAEHGPEQPPSPALPKFDSHHLFTDKREVIIIHQGTEYRLRITRQGKLILTK